jgi:hypothetical protein
MKHRIRILLWLWAASIGVPAAEAQVTVHLKNGQKLVGEAVLKDADDALELKICHSHSRTIPKTAILKCEGTAAAFPSCSTSNWWT